MRTFAHPTLAAAFVLCVLRPTVATAQSSPTSSGIAKVNTFFTDKVFTDAKCEALMKGSQPVFDCAYRGKGLQVVSTRALLMREDAIDADVVMVISSAASLDDLPKTPDMYRQLLRFNLTMDFCKISVSDDSTIMITSLMKLSQINTPSDL